VVANQRNQLATSSLGEADAASVRLHGNQATKFWPTLEGDPRKVGKGGRGGLGGFRRRLL